ncbi:MAG: hypothetical protein AAFN41_10375 [Planctomycetota bacterium]
MEFRATLYDGSELILALEDDNFAAADFDGRLTFTGFILADTGSPTEITIRTTIGALTAGTSGDIVTVSDGVSALAYAPAINWVSMSQKTLDASGSSTTTFVYTDASTGELSIEGDYGDLELATAGAHSAGTLALAMGQTMTMMARGGGLQGGNQNVPTLANCTTAAQNVCGNDCVASVDYSVTVDEDGNVTGSNCAFECESPCTD